MLRLLIAPAVAVLPALAQPGVAPAAEAPEPAAAAPLAAAGAAQPAPRRVDETALRYYASQGRRDRVEVEARRLSRLDPAWHQPADLWSARKSRDDEGPLWALYEQDRFADIDRAIAIRQAAQPGWQPSDDLRDKMKTKLLRARVVAMAKAEQWPAIVETFRTSGIGWARHDAEALWIIAEAYARENDCAEAYVIYVSLLKEHDDTSERRATIEHAIRLIPMEMVEKLIALGRRDAGGGKDADRTKDLAGAKDAAGAKDVAGVKDVAGAKDVAGGEFAPIAIDITRARISAFLHDEPAHEVSADELARFADFVHVANNPDELGLIAWYGYKRADYTLALDWFKQSLSHGGDAMIAHGLAHTLRMMGMKREAEEVSFAWREPLVNNAILFIDLLERDFTKEQPPFVEPERVARYAQVVVKTESGEGAQALAWYAYNTCQYPQALRWFERAVAWLPKEATVYGYALSLQRMHKAKEFREVVNRYDGLFPKVVQLAFDDGRRPPPPPCESDPGQTYAPARAVQAGEATDWTGRTMADTLRADTLRADTLRAVPASFPQGTPGQPPRAVRTHVPSPDDAGSAQGGEAALVKRIDFPLAVPPENMLRFSLLHTVADEEAGTKVRGREAAGPLVAHRVPGVGAMPYERWGFALLQGWDGTKEASSPTAMERDPPVGTLWALELSLREGASKKRQPVPGRAASAPSDLKASADTASTGRS